VRGYCWRVGSTVELGGKCPECGDLHEPIPDQTRCAAYCEVGGGTGEPCVLSYGHEGRCSLYEWPEGRAP
jgi:hypothetical protein